MALDAASQQFLAAMAERGNPPTFMLTPEEARAGGPVLAQMSGKGPDLATAVTHELTASDGGTFRVRVLSPHADPADAPAVIVYIHGGGWVLSDIDLQYDTVGRQMAATSGCTVVMVNYRKAPEHPFPGPVDDCWQALGWVNERRGELAAAGAPLVIAGDSAGGNLAAVMTHRSRDRGGPRIDYQVLVYPATDYDLSRASIVDPANQLLISEQSMRWFWGHYVADEQRRTDPEAAPLRAASLAGLPPALVYLARFDPLFDEGKAYAEALRDAGVEVELQIAEDQMHGFFQMANLLPGAASGLELVTSHIARFIEQHRP